MALTVRPDFNQPIPNNPFYSPEAYIVQGANGPLIVGSGISVSPAGVISASGGGGGGGTVTSITAGTGLGGGTITASGTIFLDNTAVSAGTYNYATITVDAQGRLTAASSGTAPTGTVTDVTAGTGLAGGTITASGTIDLADTAVSPGSYTYASITVDQQGRLTAASSGTTPVTAVTGTAPIAVTSGTAPVVSIDASSTTGAGAVQLNDTLTSTSTTLALTAAQGKVLQDQIDALAITSNITLAGTLDTVTGNLVTVTAAGALEGFAIGSPLPAAATDNAEYFVIVTVPAASYTPPGGSATLTHVGDWFLSNGSAWEFLNVGFDAPYASTTVAGVVELSTNAETQTGTDATLAVTPASAASTYIPLSDYAAKGDILGATGASAPTALAVGTNGQVLYADSTSTTGLKWCALPASVMSVTGTAPITVDNTDPQNPIVDINSASTTAAGVVQLDDTVISTSTTEAATANAVKTAYDLAAAAIPKSTFLAKGNLLFGTGAGTSNVLGIGTNGQVLVPNSACTTGAEWITSCGIFLCGYTNTSGLRNTALGSTAGDSITSGVDNTSIGFNSGTALTTGTNNTLVGACAGDGLTSGTNNTVIGACALTVGTTSTNNTAVGFAALGSATATGGGHTVVGIGAGGSLTTGSNNTLIAQNSGDALTTGSNNVAMGFNSLTLATTANLNVALGSCSMCNATGAQNVAVGALTLANTSGNNSVAVGTNAGAAITSGACNTLLGFSSGCLITTGASNTLIGGYIGTSSLANNVVLSDGAGTVRFQANATGAWAPDGIGFGTTGQVLSSQGTGSAPVWSTVSADPATPTTLGSIFGSTPSDGKLNTALGFQSLNTTLTGCRNIAIGWLALSAATTAEFNTVAGLGAGIGVTSGIRNALFGAGAGGDLSTGSCNVYLGPSAANNATTGSCNVAIGPGVQLASAAGDCQLAIGYSSSCNWLTGYSDKTIRPGAGIRDCADNVGTPVSTTAGSVLMSAGAGGVVWCEVPSARSTYAAGVFGCTNSCGTALGSGTTGIAYAFNVAACIQNSVTIGVSTNPNVPSIAGSVFIGSSILNTGGGGSCIDSVVIGHCASRNAPNAGSASNVVIGVCAGFCHSGSCNTFVGGLAANTCFTGTNTTAIGYNAQPSALNAFNELTLGSASVSTIRAAVTSITAISDARDKTDITALPVGLDFVNSLNPVKFTWQMREPNETKDGTSEAGFIAQDLQAAQETAGVDYLGLVYDSNPDRLEASAGKLIPVLVKAIQELSAKVTELEAKQSS